MSTPLFVAGNPWYTRLFSVNGLHRGELNGILFIFRYCALFPAFFPFYRHFLTHFVAVLF
jgi:hypothetical protein